MCEIRVEEENKYTNIRNNNNIFRNGYKNIISNFGINCCFKAGNKFVSIVYYCPIILI